MTAIANQWTGDGVLDGTALSTGNINTTGNGSAVTYSLSGTPSSVYAGHGFKVSTATTGDIARLDVTLASVAGVRFQMKLTVGAAPSAGAQVILGRVASSLWQVVLNSDRTIELSDTAGLIAASLAPAVAVGDVLVIDGVAALHTSPTSSNGRVFYRVTNLTNGSWNSTGEFFYDSLYTKNLGTTAFTSMRFGKPNSYTIASPGLTFEFVGWEPVTVSTSDVSSAAAKAYFADTPSVVNTAPSVTVTGNQTAAASSTVGITITASDVETTVATITTAVTRYTTGSAPASVTVTESTTTTPTWTAGAAGSLDVATVTATDDQGAPTVVTTEVRVPTTGEILPLAGFIPVGAAVTNTGGAASEGVAINDNSDTTFILFGASTSTQVERRYRLAPSVPRTSLVGNVATGTSRVSQDTAGTIVAKTRLYEAADTYGASVTQRKEWTDTTTTSAADQAGTLTAPECATITADGWGNLWVGFLESL